MTITYRAKRKGDEKFLLRITMQQMGRVFQQSVGTALDQQQVREQLQRARIVIIERGGKCIGYYCDLDTAPGRVYWGSLIVTPGQEGQGVGDAAVRHWYAETKRRGMRIIDGHVQVQNHRALRFWQKHGFAIVGPPQNGSYPIQRCVQE